MGQPRRTTGSKPAAPQRVVVARKLTLRSSSLPQCLCGKGVKFYAVSLEQGFCSDACYEGAKSEAEKAAKGKRTAGQKRERL